MFPPNLSQQLLTNRALRLGLADPDSNSNPGPTYPYLTQPISHLSQPTHPFNQYGAKVDPRPFWQTGSYGKTAYGKLAHVANQLWQTGIWQIGVWQKIVFP